MFDRWRPIRTAPRSAEAEQDIVLLWGSGDELPTLGRRCDINDSPSGWMDLRGAPLDPGFWMALPDPPTAKSLWIEQYRRRIARGWMVSSALADALLIPLADTARAEAERVGAMNPGDQQTWVACLLEVAVLTARASQLEPHAVVTAFGRAVHAGRINGEAQRRAGRHAFERDRQAWQAFRRGDGPEPQFEPPSEWSAEQRREWLVGYHEAEAAARGAAAAMPAPEERFREILEAWQSGNIDTQCAVDMIGVNDAAGLYAFAAACGVLIRTAPSNVEVAAALAVLAAAGPMDG